MFSRTAILFGFCGVASGVLGWRYQKQYSNLNRTKKELEKQIELIHQIQQGVHIFNEPDQIPVMVKMSLMKKKSCIGSMMK